MTMLKCHSHHRLHFTMLYSMQDKLDLWTYEVFRESGALHCILH